MKFKSKAVALLVFSMYSHAVTAGPWSWLDNSEQQVWKEISIDAGFTQIQFAIPDKAKKRGSHVISIPKLDRNADKLMIDLTADQLQKPAHEAIGFNWAAEGMAASLRRGVAGLSRDTGAVIIALADMPEVTAEAFDALIRTWRDDPGAEICRATSEQGVPGHPVLFGRRFFESLRDLEGDRGARDILREGESYLRDVALPGQAAVSDLDTPEAWAAFRARTGR